DLGHRRGVRSSRRLGRRGLQRARGARRVPSRRGHGRGPHRRRDRRPRRERGADARSDLHPGKDVRVTLTESPQAAPELHTRTLASRIGRRTASILGKYGALIALGVLLVVFSLASPYFLTLPNLLQVLNQSALSAIVAGGLTL